MDIGILNIIFHVIHISVITINLTFWMSFKTLRIAQVTLILTVFSWVGFGFYYGFGYCFLTDWHWQLKESAGETDLPYSYIKLVLDYITGRDIDPVLIDRFTILALIISLLGCAVQSVRAWKKKKVFT